MVFGRQLGPSGSGCSPIGRHRHGTPLHSAAAAVGRWKAPNQQTETHHEHVIYCDRSEVRREPRRFGCTFTGMGQCLTAGAASAEQRPCLLPEHDQDDDHGIDLDALGNDHRLNQDPIRARIRAAASLLDDDVWIVVRLPGDYDDAATSRWASSVAHPDELGSLREALQLRPTMKTRTDRTCAPRRPAGRGPAHSIRGGALPCLPKAKWPDKGPPAHRYGIGDVTRWRRYSRTCTSSVPTGTSCRGL
jgi:hypothetical protein